MQQASDSAKATNQVKLIDQYEKDYREALRSIDEEVPELIRMGKNIQALITYRERLGVIQAVHEVLQSFYALVYKNQDVLKKFHSKGLKGLPYDLIATRALLSELDKLRGSLSEDPGYFDPDNIVLQSLAKLGFKGKHWSIDEVALNEIEYMIKTLREIVEPDFVPLENSDNDKISTGENNRHIPRSVKIAVWRRDQAKCAECGSQEKLEYDHIIPVAKGGSNTERNVQLLCEKCNRQKSSNIQ